MISKCVCVETDYSLLDSNGENTGQDPEKYFWAGVLLFNQNKPGEAILAFKQALKKNPNEARYVSYYGLCLAMVDKRAQEAVALCEQAVEKDFCRAELYNNLGKVYLLKHKRKKALKTFRQGLAIDSENSELKHELKKMGLRKQPLLPSLGRKNVINILAGRMFSKMGLR